MSMSDDFSCDCNMGRTMEIGDDFSYDCMWQGKVIDRYICPVLYNFTDALRITSSDLEATVREHYKFATVRSDYTQDYSPLTRREEFRSWLCDRPSSTAGHLIHGWHRLDASEIWGDQWWVGGE